MPEEKTPAIDTQSVDTQGGEGQTKPEEGKLTQEQVDKAIQARLEREREAYEKRLTDTISKERTEWEKQSKMTQEERERELLKQKEAETSEREQRLTLRENKLDAIEALEAEGIPQASKVADFLLSVDKDAQSQNVASFIEMTKEITKDLVDKELRGTTPRAVDANKGDVSKPVPLTL